MRSAWILVTLFACSDGKHSPPKVVAPAPQPTPQAAAPAPDAALEDTVSARMRTLFGATQGPDPAAMIAELEAQRATMPEAERKLVDRSIAVARAFAAAEAERDPVKAKPLTLAAIRDMIALCEEMATLAAGDVETIAIVASSFDRLAAQIEMFGLAADIPPASMKQRARALADELVKANPRSARAWQLAASLAPYSDLEARLRGFARCVKLDAANTRCQQQLDATRTEYLQPYCEGAAIKPNTVEWREVARQPTAGFTSLEYHYETYYLAPTAKFTVRDVKRIEAGETTMTEQRPDGSSETRTLSTVGFELEPAKLAAMQAWTRALEQRGDGYALLKGGKLVYIERQAIVDDSAPGITHERIEDYCTTTRRRTLPALE